MSEDPQVKIRLSQELKTYIEEQAKSNHRTINGEIVYRLEQSKKSKNLSSNNPEVRVIDMKNGYRRLIFGKYANILELDYSQTLTILKRDIELSLNALRDSSLSKKLAFFNKDVFVHQGNNHLDIVNNGIGSLNWLTIEDHWVGTNDD